MPSIYKNQSIMIPIRVWVMPRKNIFRVELPSRRLTTNTEWIFDDKISSIKEWKPWTNSNTPLYGLNTSSFPPTCKGSDLIQFLQSDTYPYETKIVQIAAFLERDEVVFGPFKGKQIDQLYMFNYDVPNTVLLYFWAHLDVYNNLSFYVEIDPDIKDEKTRVSTNGKYIHISLYAFTSEMMYWRRTTESLCIPSPTYKDDSLHFYTLHECRESPKYPLRNRHTWIGTNSEPLYQYMKWWRKLPVDKQLSSMLHQEI